MATKELFVPTIGHVLNTFIKREDHQSHNPNKSPIAKFASKKPPSISIGKYLERTARLTKFEPELYICSLIYLDKVIKQHSIHITLLEIHRLWFVSYLVAIKFHSDEFYSNAYYAKVAGITTKELNILERKFLRLLNYHLLIPTSLFDLYKEKVEKYGEVLLKELVQN